MAADFCRRISSVIGGLRHPRHRRQSQGAQGGRRGCDRLRRRGAGLPHPERHRRGGRRGLPGPAEPQATPLTSRPARAERRHRSSRRRETAAPPWRPPRCWSPMAASSAVEQACATLLDPGEEALLPGPYWTTYPETIRLTGGIRGRGADDTDRERTCSGQRRAARRARTDRTKLLIFASPSNPGAVYPRQEIEAGLDAGPSNHGVWVLTDEIYEHLVYGSARMYSMPAVVPELADQCVIVNGVAKTYAMTGWRVGWLIAPARRHRCRHKPAVPRHLQRVPTSPSGRAWRQAVICRPSG